MAGDFYELLADIGNLSIPASETIVLVVDDEPIIVSTLERFLRKKGFIVLTAESAEDALDILGTDKLPHVVLTDKNLPAADGIELIRRGKVLAPDTAFVIMTGYATIESSIEALELGATGYLQKPFDLNKVVAHVKAALEKNLVSRRHEMLMDFVRTNVKDLVESLGSELSNLNDSMEAIERFSKAVAEGEKPEQGAADAIAEALMGWRRAEAAVAGFAGSSHESPGSSANRPKRCTRRSAESVTED